MKNSMNIRRAYPYGFRNELWVMVDKSYPEAYLEDLFPYTFLHVIEDNIKPLIKGKLTSREHRL